MLTTILLFIPLYEVIYLLAILQKFLVNDHKIKRISLLETLLIGVLLFYVFFTLCDAFIFENVLLSVIPVLSYLDANIEKLEILNHKGKYGIYR